MQYFTKTQACRLLGTTMPTLNKCIKKLQEQGHDITPMRDAYNPHLALLSEEQITAIRGFMLGYRERLQTKPAPLTPSTPAPALPAPESRPRRSQGHSGLPDGYVTLYAICREHGVDMRDAQDRIDAGELTITLNEEGWQVGTNRVKKALNAEQQEAFLAWVQTRKN